MIAFRCAAFMAQETPENGIPNVAFGPDLSAAVPGRALPLPTVVPQAAPQSVAEDALSRLKTIAETGVLFLGLSFAGGWSFMASYYQAFGISPYELDLSVPATSAFSIHMLLSSFWPLLIAMVL